MGFLDREIEFNCSFLICEMNALIEKAIEHVGDFHYTLIDGNVHFDLYDSYDGDSTTATLAIEHDGIRTIIVNPVFSTGYNGFAFLKGKDWGYGQHITLESVILYTWLKKIYSENPELDV